MPASQSLKPIIAVNARWLLAGKLEGTGWHTRSILWPLIAQHPEVNWHLFYDRKPHPSMVPKAVTAHVITPPARHPLLWEIWQEWSVPRALKKVKAAIYWSPDGLLPSRKTLTKHGLSSQTMATIHDLNFLHQTDNMPARAASYYRRVIARSAREADALLTVSETSALDLQASYQLHGKAISITGNAPQATFIPHSPAIKANSREQFSQGRPYLLFVGAFTPRKNVITLIRAFNQWKDHHPGSQLALLLVGQVLHKDKTLKGAIAAGGQDIILHGRAEGSDLNSLYAAAEAFCFPSLMEGFGIPLVEAMAAGCPIISSNSSCMPEITGGAAHLVDPLDLAAWTAAINELMDGQLPVDEMVEKGLIRAQSFQWQQSVDSLWARMEDLLSP